MEKKLLFDLKEIIGFWILVIVICLFTSCESRSSRRVIISETTIRAEEKVVIIDIPAEQPYINTRYYKVKRNKAGVVTFIQLPTNPRFAIGDTILYKF